MNTMNGNPYAEEMAGYADPRNSLEAQATLALAFEQRTANLIAAAETIHEDGGIFPNASNGLRLQILARLGLNGGAS